MDYSVVLASDHAAFEQKGDVLNYLKSKGCDVIDVGTHSGESCNFADFSVQGVKKLQEVKGKSFGIFICGTGIGMSMAANRFKNIRAAVCRSQEEARMTRLHNDANVLCLGSRISSLTDILNMIDTFLSTEFEGGRHLARIEKFNNLGEDATT